MIRTYFVSAQMPKSDICRDLTNAAIGTWSQRGCPRVRSTVDQFAGAGKQVGGLVAGSLPTEHPRVPVSNAPYPAPEHHCPIVHLGHDL
jgi:hypothetical protein